MSKFILQPEDGSVANGNLRGNDSVDLQVARNVNTQVASGYASFILGGLGNTASGTYTGAFGANNTSSGTGAISFGVGNIASGNYSLSAGLNSQSIGQGSTSIGYENIANASASSIAFSYQSITDITGVYSSIIGGYQANTYLYGQNSLASGNFASVGDAQVSNLIARKKMTGVSGGQPDVPLSLDGGTGLTGLIVPKGNNRGWSVVLQTTAVCTLKGSSANLSIGDMQTIVQSFYVKKVAGVLTISAISSISDESDTHMNSGGILVASVAGNVVISYHIPTSANNSNFQVISSAKIVENAW